MNTDNKHIISRGESIPYYELTTWLRTCPQCSQNNCTDLEAWLDENGEEYRAYHCAACKRTTIVSPVSWIVMEVTKENS